MIFHIFFLVMPKYGGNKISALGVSRKWVKSYGQRKKERRAKVSDYNGQYMYAWTNLALSPIQLGLWQTLAQLPLVLPIFLFACLITSLMSRICIQKFYWSQKLKIRKLFLHPKFGIIIRFYYFVDQGRNYKYKKCIFKKSFFAV